MKPSTDSTVQRFAIFRQSKNGGFTPLQIYINGVIRASCDRFTKFKSREEALDALKTAVQHKNNQVTGQFLILETVHELVASIPVPSAEITGSCRLP